MKFPNESTAVASMVVSELAEAGVRKAVGAPGSRSTALVLALDAHPEIELTMNVDERSAGFRALGRAMASGQPSVVVTTSGTAVANLAPAVAEAERAGVPLVVVTADRPRELVERGANQTMDHMATIGGLVRGSADIGSGGNPKLWEHQAGSLVKSAMGTNGQPGPVHLNVRFVEPTVPMTDDGRSAGSPIEVDFDQEADPSVVNGQETLPQDLPDLGPRALVVLGRGEYGAGPVLGECEGRAIPVLVSALSGGRGIGGVDAYHHLLGGALPKSLEPSGVMVVGRVSPADRLVKVTQGELPVVHVDPNGMHTDPAGTMTIGVRGEPVDLIKELGSNDPEFEASWRRQTTLVRSAVSSRLDAESEMTGPAIASAVSRAKWDSLVVGSSLSIRDVDAYLSRTGPVYSNRGVSGIDGFNSTAIGVADVIDRTLGLVGDLSFLHDCNGYLTDRVPNLVTVVFDNNGGGLFDQLPQARHADGYERLFVTPHSRDLSMLALFHHVEYVETRDPRRLGGVIDDALDSRQPIWIHAPVDRDVDLALRRELDSLALSALEGRN